MRFWWSRECMALTSQMKSSRASGWLSTSVFRHFTATFSCKRGQRFQPFRNLWIKFAQTRYKDSMSTQIHVPAFTKSYISTECKEATCFIRKTTEVVLPWPSSFFNKSFFHLRELNKYKAQVSLPPSLQASATLLSSQHQTSRPPASQTPSDPSLGWGRSEPAAAHQEEHHHHHHHRAVRTALHPPGLEEVWETAYERRRSAGPAGGNLLRLDAYH